MSINDQLTRFVSSKISSSLNLLILNFFFLQNGCRNQKILFFRVDSCRDYGKMLQEKNVFLSFLSKSFLSFDIFLIGNGLLKKIEFHTGRKKAWKN